MERAEALLNDQPHREVLSKNIASLAVPDAADRIVNEIIKLW